MNAYLLTIVGALGAKAPVDPAVNMEHQPPNTNMNPSPPKPQESEGAEGNSGAVRRRRMWPVAFGFLGLLAGLICGGIYFSQCQQVYKSEATVTILPRERIFISRIDDARKFDVSHDRLIGEDNIVTKSLIKYGVSELPTLRDLSLTDQINEIQNNLVVFQNREERFQYELEYTSLNPRDAQTVLATIISTYEKHLSEKYRDVSAETMELLKKMSDKFHEEVESVDKRLQIARDPVEALASTSKSEQIQFIIAEVTKKIEVGKSQLAELSSDLRSSEAALENGREACSNLVWILEEGDGIHGDSEQTMELSFEEAKTLDNSPEQIIQRHIALVKQQIEELRLTLHADQAAFSENYGKAVRSTGAVRSEPAAKEIRELLLLREKFMTKADIADQYIMEQSSYHGSRHQGFIVETTRPAGRGREIWPVLAVVLPVFGLLGCLLGLGTGGIVALVVNAFDSNRVR